jgi:hypothetical protein
VSYLSPHRLDPDTKIAIRLELDQLANSGAAIATLEASLRRHELSEDDYEELWLYAWALERRAERPVAAGSPGTVGYQYEDAAG